MVSVETRLRDAALAYAAMGWCVFPIISGGRRPATDHGYKDATADLEVVGRYWQEHPDANIGLACGASGLVVLDVDVKGPNGFESLYELLAGLPDGCDATLTATTPSGGEHLYYHANGHEVRCSVGRLGPGLDVRAVGGYVLVPPSIRDDGAYGWRDDQGPGDMAILPIPDEMVAMLTQDGEDRAPVIDGDIPEGARNSTLASLAGTMRRRGASPGAILAALREENQSRCRPPLGDAEIRRVAQSIGKYQPAKAPEVRHYHRTDTGNAERFIADHGDRVRYDHERERWLVWDGKRWAPDEDGAIERLAVLTVRRMYAAASDIGDKTERKAAGGWALRTESAHAIGAMLRRAQSHEKVATRQSRLDKSPWLLNCANGTLDLRTGELRPHDPADMLSKLVPTAYKPDAQAPRWARFQAEIACGDPDLVRFKQKAFGYGLAGDTREQVIFVPYGGGANGKSTELTAILEVLGPDYTVRTPTTTLLVKRWDAIPNDVARLRGARFVAAFEAEAGRRLAESFVKQLTGQDRLAARFLHHEWFEFTPECKVFLSTNHKPIIKGTDHAIWRRIRLIPYNLTLTETEQDKTLPEKLRAEAEGILAWLVAGCLAWQREGLGQADAVQTATASYRDEMDLLGGFLSDSCIMGPDLVATSKALHTAYLAWCETNGEKALSKRALGLALGERGLDSVRIGSKQARGWRGIGVRAEL